MSSSPLSLCSGKRRKATRTSAGGRLTALEMVKRLDTTEDAGAVTRRLLHFGALPREAVADAAHVTGAATAKVRRRAAVGSGEEPAGAVGVVGKVSGSASSAAGPAGRRPNRGVERVAEQRAVQLPVRVSMPAAREHGLDAPGLDPEAVVAGLADRAGAAVFLPAAAESDALPAARIEPVVDRGHELVSFRFGL